jgi:citrate synthase
LAISDDEHINKQTNPARRNCQSSQIDTEKGNLTYQAMPIVKIASNNFEEKLQMLTQRAGKFQFYFG